MRKLPVWPASRRQPTAGETWGVNCIGTFFLPTGWGAWKHGRISVDQDGVPIFGTALYQYELVATAAGEEMFRESKTMTVYDSFDFDAQPPDEFSLGQSYPNPFD